VGNPQELARPFVQAGFQVSDPRIELCLAVTQTLLLRLRLRDGSTEFPQSGEVAVQVFLRIELPASGFVFGLLRRAQALS